MIVPSRPSTPVRRALPASVANHGVTDLQEHLSQVGDSVMQRLRSGELEKPLSPASFAEVSARSVVPTQVPTHVVATDALSLIKGQALAQAGLTGLGQIVAVIDTGFDYQPASQSVAFYDTILGGITQTDPRGHGTHVTSDVLKVAPDAQIVNIRVVNEYGACMPTHVLAGLEIVKNLYDQGQPIDVVNLSLSSPFGVDRVNEAIGELVRRGITVVAAVGNAGPKRSTVMSPGDLACVIAVGSAANATQVSDFSGIGPLENGQSGPHLLAPGEFIAGWVPTNSKAYEDGKFITEIRAMEPEALAEFLKQKPFWMTKWKLDQSLLLDLSPQQLQTAVRAALPHQSITKDGQLIAPGTSFAAPLVAGVLAALEQKKDMTPEESRALLMDTAQPLQGYSVYQQGAGLIDAGRALQKLSISL